MLVFQRSWYSQVQLKITIRSHHDIAITIVTYHSILSAITMTATTSIVDVLILGGGPAGLASALGLARQLHTAIVFNSSKYRNANAKHMHNVPGWDHRPPPEFRAKVKSDILSRYETIQFKDVEVKSIVKLESGRFEATDTEGNKYLGKKLVLAAGVKDVMPDIPGFTQLWGSAMYVANITMIYNRVRERQANLC
jgi:thioredoxin reductase